MHLDLAIRSDSEKLADIILDQKLFLDHEHDLNNAISIAAYKGN
jgi:hypothetical protein